jgi:hypothetical protein
VARAKRTDRAEARRRYRATLAESDPDANLEEDETGVVPAGAAAATAKKGSTRTAPAPEPARPGLAYAFRSAFRPLDLRGDLKALPMLLRHPAFLFPVVLSGLSVALIPLVGLNALTSTFYQYFSFTAPLGTSFIAGFFAPRASWLVGGLAALASVGFQAIAFSSGSFGGFLDVFSDPATGGTLARDAAARLILSQALFVGVPSGAFFAAAAAWYRRFLKSASPNRARQAQSNSGRRPDGKVPKKQESRPLLARKR